ncbi:efflux RND transporter periplasmic adaptor subunit [Vogesella sp. GCM10023246]|uniref:Efflux RND transporter periplasmic adaptor subunit n=1 Tax=Vogesella oryzagri TaxID=3160864 RepID=A0ABV1LZB2_9NEIS
MFRTNLLLASLLLLPSVYAAPLATLLLGDSASARQYSTQGVIQSQRSAQLSVPVAGRLTALNVRAGQQVATGQLLAQVDGEAAQQTAAASQAQIAAANAQLAQARRDYQRSAKLAAEHFLSGAALDQARAQLQTAEAQARAQIAAARAAGAQAGLYRLTAPFAGTIARVNGDQGALAMPGQPIVELYDPNALRVELQLPASAYAAIRQDAPVSLSWRGQALQVGRVEWFPATDAGSQTRTVRINLAAGSKPAVGEMASASFVTRGQPDVRLSVPATAVSHQREFDAVYVVDAAGKPGLRYVRLGTPQGNAYPVLSGLKAGERIAANAEQAAALAISRAGAH